MKFNIKLFSISCLLITLILGSSSFIMGQEEVTEEQLNQKEDQVVAVIDNEEVLMSELEKEANIQQTMVQLQQQNPQMVRFLYASPEGQNFLKAFQKNQLDNLIARKLLEKEAERQDISLTASDKNDYFNDQIELIKKQQDLDDEELINTLNQQGIESLEEFKEIFIQQQENNLIVQKFIETVVLKEVKITDERAKEIYEQGQFQVEFEEIKDQIKQDLAQQEYINQLKEDADIDIKL
ncbi:MAG: hypothetical protein ACOC4G_09795 [Bacillota bacterium]